MGYWIRLRNEKLHDVLFLMKCTYALETEAPSCRVAFCLSLTEILSPE